MKRLLNLTKWYDKILPVYIPRNRIFSPELHLAIWSTPTMPCSWLDILKSMRITIRKDHKPIYIIKKGEI